MAVEHPEVVAVDEPQARGHRVLHVPPAPADRRHASSAAIKLLTRPAVEGYLSVSSAGGGVGGRHVEAERRGVVYGLLLPSPALVVVLAAYQQLVSVEFWHVRKWISAVRCIHRPPGFIFILEVLLYFALVLAASIIAFIVSLYCSCTLAA